MHLWADESQGYPRYTPSNHQKIVHEWNTQQFEELISQ